MEAIYKMVILRAKEVTYFSAGFHDESEDTIGSTSDSQTTHKLVSQRFTLSDGTETTVGNLFSKKFDLTIFHLESLLNQSSQFSDSLGLFTKNILGSGGQNDDFGSLWGNSDFDTGVTVFGKFLIKYCE